MPRKKTVLAGGFQAFELADLERQVRSRMQAYRGPTPSPAELRSGLTAVLLCRDVSVSMTLPGVSPMFPEVFLGPSPGAERERLELAKFITNFPHHAIAALRCVFQPPPGDDRSNSALIREFLLTQLYVVRPDGQLVMAVGEADGDVAQAVQARYGRRSISVVAVKAERSRLERRFGMPISQLVDFYLQVTSEIDPPEPEERAQARKNRRDAELSGVYKPPG